MNIALPELMGVDHVPISFKESSLRSDSERIAAVADIATRFASCESHPTVKSECNCVEQLRRQGAESRWRVA